MARIAEPRDYWIAPEAINITLNALGDPDRIQGSVGSGSAILCYMKGVQGLEYDNGHNYRSWPISLSPTFFNTTSRKYIYVAIPRTQLVGTQAIIVFPSQKLDVYGRAEGTVNQQTGEETPGEQIGSTDYYYIWLQGIISASIDEGDATQDRTWEQEIQTGTLSTDEAKSTTDTDWYTFSRVTNVVTFLKEITMAATSKFQELKADIFVLAGNLLRGVLTKTSTGIADDTDEYVVTPGYLSKKYLRKDTDDTANGEITFKAGLKVGEFRSRIFGSGAVIDEEGNAEFESIYSRSFISTPEFRFNRIAVTEGEQWCTNGYGTIKEVEIASTTEGYITLKLEENDWASVAEGDICRGIYNDIANNYETRDLDDDTELYAGPTEADTGGFGFSSKAGFFTSYFWVVCMDSNTDAKCYNRKGECCFKYQLRHAGVPHPCAFMKFAQYGSFTRADRRSSSYATSIGHYYEMVLDGVQTWKIQSPNIVYRKGYLGDMTVEVRVKDADGNYTGETREVELRGYGLYVQDNVYFGNAVIQLDPVTLEELTEQLKFYDVSLTEYIDVITIDDVGNCIGGLYTESGENGEYRTYRIRTTLLVRKNGVLLTLAADNADAGKGTYKINVQPHGCSTMIQGSTIYITGISNIKDGVPGTPDDVNFDYDEMRQMSHCSVDIIVNCEGKGVITKTLPVSIKHDSQPFVGADITNEFSAVSWNTQAQQYVGLPIVFDMKMWKNNEPLDVRSVSVACLTLDGSSQAVIPAQNITKSIVTVNGTKQARISINALPEGLPLVTELAVTTAANYAGVSYERTLIHTINKSTDTNVYSLLPSVSEVIVNKNTGGLSVNTLNCAVICDSSDNKHYTVAYADFATHKIAIYYRKFYHDGTSDTDETAYTNNAIPVDSSVSEVRFYLYGKNGNTVDRTTVHDQEGVPVIAEGQDGKGVEYIFFQQDSETPVPTINDVAASRQADSYCPYNTAGTQQWTDEPVGVGANSRFEFYAQRKKVNGVWQPFSTAKIWNRYVTDGVSPYIIDLSNEQSFVNCDQDGNVVGSYESSRLMLFKGTAYAFTDFNIKVTPVNIKCNGNTSAFTLTDNQKATAQVEGYFTLTPTGFDDLSAAAQINIECTLKTNTSIKLVAVYKINKNIAGGEGQDAVMYSLIPSLNVIHKSNGVFSDSTLGIQVKKTVGTTSTILSTYQSILNEGLSLYYSANGGTETPLQAISISTSTFVGNNGTYGILRLKDSSNVIVDSERINVVQDGEDGQDGVDGQDGEDSVVFELIPSQSVISFTRAADGTTLAPSSVNLWCNYAKIVGNNEPQVFLGTVVDNIKRVNGAPYNMFCRLHYADGSYSIWDWVETGGVLGAVSTGVMNIPSSTTHNSKQYVAVEFCLSTSPGYSTVADSNIITRTTVSIKKDGVKGSVGDGIFVNDRGIFSPGTTYYYEQSGDVYVRDMVRYEIGGIMYGFLVKTKDHSVSSAPTSASGDSNWEAAGIVNTVIANTIFGTNANIGGFMASANKLATSLVAYRVLYRGSYSSSNTGTIDKAIYRGTWTSGTTYYGSNTDSSDGMVFKDVVYYSGSYYTPKNAGAVSNTSTPPPANTSAWKSISSSDWEYDAIENGVYYNPSRKYKYVMAGGTASRHMVLYNGNYYVVRNLGATTSGTTPSASSSVWRLATSEEIAAATSDTKEYGERYVDIHVFVLNGIEGFIRMRQQDDTVWSVDNTGKQTLGIEGGKRVELSPNSKDISIYKEGGVLSTTLDGDTVNSMASLFGDTSGSVSGTTGNKSCYGNNGAGRVEKGIQVISSAFTTNGPTTISFSYQMVATGDRFYSSNSTMGATYGPMPSPEKDSSGNYVFKNYASANLCVVKSDGNGGYTLVRTLSFVVAAGETVRKNGTNESGYIYQAGTYYLAIMYEFGVYANPSYRSYLSWANISLQFTTNIYLSRIFANGFSYGSSANNFIAAVNEVNNALRFKCVTNNGKTGIELSSDGLKAMAGGIWGRIMPTILVVDVHYEISTETLTATTKYSAAGGSATVQRLEGGGEGMIKVTFPSGFSNYQLSRDNTMVIITPYGRNNVNGHLISLTATTLTAEFNDDTSNNMSSFLLELKYIG